MYVGNPIWLEPLRRTAMMSAPIIEPRMLPAPPFKLAPPITTYPARYAATDDGRKQLAMTVLNGMFGGIDVEQKHFDFKMPDFTHLDDATLAAVLNYVVFDLDHAADEVKPIAAEEIAAERAHPVDGTAVREHRTKLLTALGL